MFIMDDALVFQYIEFLRKKTANTTLDILKKFIVKAKKLFRKKVIQVRVDSGYE